MLDDVFQSAHGLPVNTAPQMIKLFPGSVPYACKPMRLAQSELELAKTEITRQVAEGLMIPCSSPFAAQIMFVK